MARKTHTEAQARYDKANRRVYGFRLHNEIDKDIIEKLSSVPSMQGYIKALIRADIAHTGSAPENSTPVPEKANSVPVLSRKKHPSTKDLLKALEPYIQNYGDSMYDLVNALAADIMGYDIDS